jgi:hypothetical protein
MMEPKKWVALPFVAFSAAGILTDLLGPGAALVIFAYAVLGAAWFISESSHPLPAVVLLLLSSALGVLTGLTPATWWSALAAILILSGHEVVRWIAIPYALFGGLTLGVFLGQQLGSLIPALSTAFVVLLGTLGAAAAVMVGRWLVYADITPLFQRAEGTRQSLGEWFGLDGKDDGTGAGRSPGVRYRTTRDPIRVKHGRQ